VPSTIPGLDGGEAAIKDDARRGIQCRNVGEDGDAYAAPTHFPMPLTFAKPLNY
jgi:hypothetical protein